MRVKMLVDAPGSPDGVTVLEYANGTVYDVPDDLGSVFVAEEYAEETTEDVTAQTEPEPELDGEDAADAADEAEAEVEAKSSPPAENK